MRSLTGALCLLLLTGALSLHASPRSVAQTPGIYIAVGDSIAAGIGSSLPRERGYAAIAHEWLTRESGAFVPFENLAVPGETARAFIDNGQLDQFRAAVSRAREGGLPIKVVTLSLGGNEMLALESSGLPDREAGLEAFRASFAEALDAVRATLGPDVRLVVTTYYDLTEGDASLANTDAWWVEQFNAVIRENALERAATIADVHARFVSQISELTLYPVDVHPNNAGHLAIAETVWRSLALDTTAPEINAPKRIEASRDTPTLRFNATDSTSLAAIALESPDVQFTQPLAVENGEYIALIDIDDLTTSEATITIVASDPAGNITRHDVVVTRVASRPEGDID